MEKTIKNRWTTDNGQPYERAAILNHTVHPEGLDVQRLRFNKAGTLTPNQHTGHIISVLKGSGEILAPDEYKVPLHIEAGVHLYLPPGYTYALHANADTELLQVSGASAEQARGDKLLLRDEQFVSACATGSQTLRWILTPQYLSRRIFLHHDKALLSKSGNPVSWFRTTMFDVTGLPVNDEGLPVFKMSYNSRTEFNVCYDVKGKARVRMAEHPYKDKNQPWGPWLQLDSQTTYHLNESENGPDAEHFKDDKSSETYLLRNKHEVYITEGYVSLFCLFDPAPTGVEKHRPGEYSDYEPLSRVLGTEAYEVHKKEIARFDEMVDHLSMAKALNQLEKYENSDIWKLYKTGADAQNRIESDLFKALQAEENGRSFVIAPWMQVPDMHESEMASAVAS